MKETKTMLNTEINPIAYQSSERMIENISEKLSFSPTNNTTLSSAGNLKGSVTQQLVIQKSELNYICWEVLHCIITEARKAHKTKTTTLTTCIAAVLQRSPLQQVNLQSALDLQNVVLFAALHIESVPQNFA